MTHTSTEQPEALRLARKFEEVGFMGDHRFAQDHWCRQAAAELRRQHARIEELEAELAALKAAPAKVTVEQVVELEVDDLIDRLLGCPVRAGIGRLLPGIRRCWLWLPRASGDRPLKGDLRV